MGVAALAGDGPRAGGGGVIYLSSVTMPRHWPALAAAGCGIMLTPAGGVRLPATEALSCWGADTGCFNQGASFQLDRYLTWLERMAPAQSRCLFATAPDVVGDAAATWERSRDVLPVLRRMGYRAALVAQDGIEATCVDWSSFDVLFVGGTTGWKLTLGYEIAAEARRRSKWTHQGRVNSRIRLRAARAAGFDSADGTHSSFGPDKRVPQMVRWMGEIRRQPGLLLV